MTHSEVIKNFVERFNFIKGEVVEDNMNNVIYNFFVTKKNIIQVKINAQIIIELVDKNIFIEQVSSKIDKKIKYHIRRIKLKNLFDNDTNTPRQINIEL